MNINPIKNIINRDNLVLNCLLLYLIVYTLKVLYTVDIFVGFFLIFIPLFFVLLDKKFKQSLWVWFPICVLLGYYLFKNYYTVANHYFVLIYLCISVLIANCFRKNFNSILRYNVQVILTVVYFFAGFYKLITIEFINGSLLTYLGLEGALFTPFHLFDTYDNFVKTNNDIIKSLYIDNFNPNLSVTLLAPFEGYTVVMYILTLTTIIGEFLASISFMIWSKTRWTHVYHLIFLYGLMCIRIETGFISLLALMGLILIDKKYMSLMLAYTILFVICIIFMILDYGFM